MASHDQNGAPSRPGAGVGCSAEVGTELSHRGHHVGASELTAVLAETGCSKSQLARSLGVSSSLIDQFTDGKKPLSLDWIERMPLGVRIRLLQRALDRATAERDSKISALGVDAHVRRTASAAGEFAAVVDEVMADGVIEPHERPRLARATMRLELVAHHASRDVAVGGGR
jgi:plasmid maintenance system antidote protein VapI